jgi:hypothetical protein
MAFGRDRSGGNRNADRIRSEGPDRAPGLSRLGAAAAWVSAVCCLPYLVLKAAWTIGMPVGIADRSVLDGNGGRLRTR